ncbi:MAG: MotA/TolQ/ExbB proton channel family protein [Desulfobacterales bacterium]
MDLATVIGLFSGAGLIVSAVLLGGSAGIFMNVPGILIVVGGTLATTFIKFALKDVLNSFAVAMKAFVFKLERPEDIIRTMVDYARLAKKEGLIALDQEKPRNVYMAKALRYLADGFDADIIEEMLNKDIRITVQRHSMGQSVFRGMGTSAPAFGMIGTLIGLVQMLSAMSDPSSIGPAMAVALLTTLYGALIANLVCLPLADKLKLRSHQEQTNKTIIREAAVKITQAVSPSVLEEALKVYLSPKTRDQIGPRPPKENTAPMPKK